MQRLRLSQRAALTAPTAASLRRSAAAKPTSRNAAKGRIHGFGIDPRALVQPMTELSAALALTEARYGNLALLTACEVAVLMRRNSGPAEACNELPAEFRLPTVNG